MKYFTYTFDSWVLTDDACKGQQLEHELGLVVSLQLRVQEN